MRGDYGEIRGDRWLHRRRELAQVDCPTPATSLQAGGMAIWLSTRNGLERSAPESLQRSPWARDWLVGMASTALTDACTFPLDTLKKNLQARPGREGGERPATEHPRTPARSPLALAPSPSRRPCPTSPAPDLGPTPLLHGPPACRPMAAPSRRGRAASSSAAAGRASTAGMARGSPCRPSLGASGTGSS